MLKYYFGYTNSFGNPSPIRWVEDNGVPVGGNTKCIAGNRHEITQKDFTYAALFALKEDHPYKEPSSD